MGLIISPLIYLCNVLNISPLCHCLSWRYGTPWVFLHSTEKWTWTRYVTIVTGTCMPSIIFRIPWYLQQLVVCLRSIFLGRATAFATEHACVIHPSSSSTLHLSQLLRQIRCQYTNTTAMEKKTRNSGINIYGSVLLELTEIFSKINRHRMFRIIITFLSFWWNDYPFSCCMLR